MTHDASTNPNFDLTPQVDLPGSHYDAVLANREEIDQMYHPVLPDTPPLLGMHDTFTVMATQHRATTEAEAVLPEKEHTPDYQKQAKTGLAAARAVLASATEVSLTPNEQARKLAVELGITVAVRKDDRGNAVIVPLFPKANRRRTAA